MGIKNLFGRGIGFNAGEVGWVVTRGYGQGPATVVPDPLEEPLVIDFGERVFTLRFLVGEVLPIPMTLKGRNPTTRAFAAYDLTGATSIKLTVRKPGVSPIINARDLTPVTPATSGRVTFTPTPTDTGVGGRYKALAVVTYPGSPNPIVRKFPGDIIIEDAIA